VTANTAAPKAIRHLAAIVPMIPSIPVQPIIQKSEEEYALFDHLRRFPWVLTTYRYDDPKEAAIWASRIITPAEEWLKEKGKKV